MVGTEGGIGLIIYSIVLPILCTATCTGKSCVEYPVGATKHYDSASEYFAQMGHSGKQKFRVQSLP